MISPLAIGLSAGLGATAGLGLAAGGCAYAALWPASQLFGPTLIAPPRPRRRPPPPLRRRPQPPLAPAPPRPSCPPQRSRHLLSRRQPRPGRALSCPPDCRRRSPHRQPLLVPSQPGPGL